MARGKADECAQAIVAGRIGPAAMARVWIRIPLRTGRDHPRWYRFRMVSFPAISPANVVPQQEPLPAGRFARKAWAGGCPRPEIRILFRGCDRAVLVRR